MKEINGCHHLQHTATAPQIVSLFFHSFLRSNYIGLSNAYGWGNSHIIPFQDLVCGRGCSDGIEGAGLEPGNTLAECAQAETQDQSDNNGIR